MSSSQPPLIGITSGTGPNAAGTLLSQVGQAYITSVRKAGGLPIIIPLGIGLDQTASLISRIDGLLLTGGGDIDPQHFNGQSHPKVYGLSPERDALEFALLEETLGQGKPLLAICRGIQVLNVAFGGDLHTHIQDQLENPLKHDWFPGYPRDKIAHSVSLTCGSKLHEIFGGDDIRVNSLHHQGINRVGKGLKAIAFAPDGLVEGLAVEDADFALGVQWHPECLPDDAGNQALFRAFIEAC